MSNIVTQDQAAQISELYEEYLLAPCKSKEELNQWIQTFLNISFPNYTLDENSTSNPLDFIWDVYSAVLHADNNRTTFVGAASRACMKCLAAGTLVATPGGSIPIEQMKVGDIVYDENGQHTKVTVVHNQGMQECVNLMHHNTVLATCTPEHVWQCFDERRPTRWRDVKVKDLYKGMRVRRVEIQQPLGSVHEPLAYALGALIGDGSCNECGVRISSIDDKIPNKVASILGTTAKKVNSNNYTYMIQTPKRGVKWHFSGFYEKYLRGKLAHTKQAPLDVIKTWDRESLIQFVAGLLDTDGNVSIEKNGKLMTIRLAMQCEDAIKAFAYALETIWQVPRAAISERETFDRGRQRYKNGNLLFCNLSSNYFCTKILRDLDPHLVSPQKKWKPEYEQITPNNFSPDGFGVRVVPCGVKQCYDLTVDTPSSLYLLQNGMVTHNTLSVSVLEFLLMLHFGKSIVHLSAILDQSMACIGYLDNFLALPAIKKFSKTDSQRKKILRGMPANEFRSSLPASLRVLVATKESANGMRGNILCVPGTTEIWVESWTDNQRKHSLCAKMSAESIYKRVQNNETVMVQTVNESTLEFEFKPVLKAYKRKEPNRLQITTKTGASIVVTKEHPLAVSHDGKALVYVNASDLRKGDQVILKNKSTQAKSSQFAELGAVYPLSAILPFDETLFTPEDILLGSLLGDGCVYRRNYPEGHPKHHIKFNPHFSITKTAAALPYLEWVNGVMQGLFGKGQISSHSHSGYTGAPQYQYVSGNHPVLGPWRDKWYATNRKKIIPVDFELTMPALAIWLMDDSDTNWQALSTYCFTRIENDILAGKINKLLGFECARVSSFMRDEKEMIFLSLRWPRAHSHKFYELTKYIHPSYRYKINKQAIPCVVCGEEYYFHTASHICNKPMCRFEMRQKSVTLETIRSIKPVKVRENTRSAWVYDFEVKDNHNFIARRFVVHNCLDEVDLIDPNIISEAAMIADPDQLGRPPIFIYISSRKSAFGPVQDKIDESSNPESGIRLHKWSLTDFMQKCTPDIYKPEMPRATIHIHRDSLEIKSSEDYQLTPSTMQAAYDSREVYSGCVSCPALLVCQGRAVEQKSQPSKALRNITFIKTVLRETKDPEKIKAQLMNLKPESAGNVFNRFDRAKQAGPIEKAWEFAFGVPWQGGALSKRYFREMLSSNDWYVTCGVDFGYVDPAVSTLVAHHRAFDKVIVLHGLKAQGFSNPDWLAYTKERIFIPYGFDLLCPDTADKSAPSVAAKLGMQARSRKPHRIDAGISWLQNHIWSPTKQAHSLFVIDDEFNRPMIDSLERYQYKRSSLGFVFDTYDPDSQYSHEIDALRYACDPWVVYSSANVASSQPKPSMGVPLYYEHQKAKEAALKDERRYLMTEIKQHYSDEYSLTLDIPTDTEDNESAEGTHGLYFSF